MADSAQRLPHDLLSYSDERVSDIDAIQTEEKAISVESGGFADISQREKCWNKLTEVAIPYAALLQSVHKSSKILITPLIVGLAVFGCTASNPSPTVDVPSTV